MKQLKNCTIITYDLHKEDKNVYRKLNKLFKQLNGEKIASTTYIFPGLIRDQLENIINAYPSVKRYAIIEIYIGTMKKKRRRYTNLELLQILLLLLLMK